MIVPLKIFLILVAQKTEAVFHSLIGRYLVKNYLSNNQELPIWKLLSWNFIRNITAPQIISLAIMASFTLITFPLGVWLNSFQAGAAYPLMSMFYGAINLILTPLTLIGYASTVKEITFNRSTLTGLLLIEIAICISITGWYLIYKGNT